MDRIKTIDLLKQADEAYYNKADSFFDDHEYTVLKDEAKKLWPNDPYFKKVGAPAAENSPWKVIKHSIPMGSIDNIKVESPNTFVQDVFTNTKKWWAKLGFPVLLAQYKLDGCSVNLEYRDFENEMITDEAGLVYLSNAILRGDGVEGEDILGNVVSMKGVAASADKKEIQNIHCEIVLPKENFRIINELQEKAGDKAYANCRNAAAGIARRFDGKYANFLRVIPFDIVYASKDYDSHSINKYKKDFGFVETAFIETWEELEQFYKDTLAKRDEIPYDIDGIVVKVDDTALRSKDQPELPEWTRALKFPPEEKVFKADELRWYVGKTGKYTPVLHNHAGVQFQAKVVHEVTLHNYNQFCKHKIAQGDKVSVVIAGDVIPKVASVVERSGQPPFECPKICHECGSLLRVDENFLYCTAEGCPGRVKAIINSHVKEMGIEEVGPELIEKLYRMGQAGEIKFNNFPDLYTLTTRDIMKLEGYQEKSALKVITNIHAKVEVSMAVFIASLGIPNIGAKTIEKLGTVSLDELFKMSLDTMKGVEGIGAKTAAQIKEGLDKNYAIIGQLFASGVKIKAVKNTVIESDRFKGKSFCFTGDIKEIDLDTGKPYTREEAWSIVKKHGGEVKSGVSKKLSVLVLASMDSGTTKANKARELGVEMISSNEFFKRAGIL